MLAAQQDGARAPLIAVVDDDEAFGQLMTEFLGLEGYRVVIYRSGAAARRALPQECPDLLIVDLRLERADTGWDLLRALRASPATRALPAIVCSADLPALRANATDLALLGCAALPKPFDLDVLALLVVTSLYQWDGQRPYARPRP